MAGVSAKVLNMSIFAGNRIGLYQIIFSLFWLSLGGWTKISLAQELVMGVEDIEYYPYYAKRDGRYAGFAKELFDEFGKEYGHNIRYRLLPIKRLYSDLLNGRVDLKFPDNPHWAKKRKLGKEVLYSDGVVDYIDGVMVLPKNVGKGKAALKNLGTVRGFSPWTFMGDVESGEIILHENSDLTGLIKSIKSRRVDGVYFNILVARYFLKYTFFEEGVVVFDEGLPHTRDTYYISTLRHKDILRQFNEYMIKNAEFVEGLKIKYEVKP